MIAFYLLFNVALQFEHCFILISNLKRPRMGIYHGDSEEENEESQVFKSKNYFYLKRPDSSLSCSKCKETCDVPFVVEWKVFCKDCKPSNAVVDENLAAQLGDMEVFCTNWSSGCSKSCKRKDLTEHLKICEFSVVKCPKFLFGCKVEGTKQKVKDHVCAVTADFLVEKLMQLVIEQQKEINAFKMQLRLHDGYFLDFNDDVQGLNNGFTQLKAELDSKVDLIKEIGKQYIITNPKYNGLIDFSKDDVDLASQSISNDTLLNILRRIKYYTLQSIRLPLNSSTVEPNLLNTFVESCTAQGKSLKSITFVGDKTKNAIVLSDNVISYLIRCSARQIRFENISALYFDNYINEILKQNSSVKIELVNCSYNVQNDRVKIA
eukprot:NODE_52_length_30984_cov_1.383358.p12 type:complete len:378 gc:universal NODE_52_length_30984_cov_1.383358:28148-27015(-)